MDALVAEKVMGWKAWKPDWFNDPNPTNWLDEKSGPTKNWHTWSPSTSIEAAWEVVEKLEMGDYRFKLTHYSDGWYALFCNYTDKLDLVEHTACQLETAPLGICLAALIAMGVKR